MQRLGCAKLAIDHAKGASVVLNAGRVESLIDGPIVRKVSVSLWALVLCWPADVLVLGIEVRVPALLVLLVVNWIRPCDYLLLWWVVVEDLLRLLLRLNHRFDLRHDLIVDVRHRTSLFFADVALLFLFDAP